MQPLKRSPSLRLVAAFARPREGIFGKSASAVLFGFLKLS
jgi:hypothetical protein